MLWHCRHTGATLSVVPPAPADPPRCLNAPTAQRAGWAIPIGTYTHENVTAGTWRYFDIPAMEIADKNFVRVGLRGRVSKSEAGTWKWLNIPPQRMRARAQSGSLVRLRSGFGARNWLQWSSLLRYQTLDSVSTSLRSHLNLHCQFTMHTVTEP